MNQELEKTRCEDWNFKQLQHRVNNTYIATKSNEESSEDSFIAKKIVFLNKQDCENCLD